jgi:hypothetical protein
MPAPQIIGKPSLDAGVPMSSMSQGAASTPVRLTIPIGATTRVAQNDSVASDPPPPTQPPQQPPEQNPPGSDAGVPDSASDLPPEVPDAGPIATPDAGQPLHR